MRRLGSVCGYNAPRRECCVRKPGLLLRAATPWATCVLMMLSACSGSAGCNSLSANSCDTAIEVLRQGCDGEVRAGALPGTDRIELLLECDAVEFLAAIGEQLVQHLGDAFLALGLLGLGPVADVTQHRDGVADILGLHDQLQPVREGAHDRVERRRRHDQPCRAASAHSGSLVGLASPSEMDSWPPKPPPWEATGAPEPRGSITPEMA